MAIRFDVWLNRIVAVMLVVFMLMVITACSTTGQLTTDPDKVDPVATIRAVCIGLEPAHQLFLAGIKDEEARRIELKVKAGADAVCAHPEKVADLQGGAEVVSDAIARIIALSNPPPDD